MDSWSYRIRLQFYCGLSFIFYFSPLAFANELTPINHLYVAQEIFRQNGVLISRPKPLHTQLIDIVTRHKFKSLEDYSQWLENNIHYQSDGKVDTWAKPEQTLLKGSGDCEDYTLLNTSVMQVLGYQPHFLALVRNGRRAHAICTFKYNGYFLWFDNAKLKKTSCPSLEQLAKNISNQYQYSALLEYNFKTKSWNILYKKS